MPECEDNIVFEMVFRMQAEFGADPSELEAVVFPCISRNTFQVDMGVAKMFRIAGLEDCILEDRELVEYRIDLRRAAIMLLVEAGVKQSNIEMTPYSTDSAYFNSHRLSRQAIAGSDLKLLSATEYELPRMVPPADKEVQKINPQNLLIVKKL